MTTTYQRSPGPGRGPDSLFLNSPDDLMGLAYVCLRLRLTNYHFHDSIFLLLQMDGRRMSQSLAYHYCPCGSCGNALELRHHVLRRCDPLLLLSLSLMILGMWNGHHLQYVYTHILSRNEDGKFWYYFIILTDFSIFSMIFNSDSSQPCLAVVI